MYHSTDLLTVRGVAHLVVHGTSGSTSYETIPPVQLEISGDVLSTADMVVQRRDGPRRLREIDDDDMSLIDNFHAESKIVPKTISIANCGEDMVNRALPAVGGQ